MLTPEVSAQAQQLLGAGWSRREVAEEVGLKLDTLRDEKIKRLERGVYRFPTPVDIARKIIHTFRTIQVSIGKPPAD